MEEDFFGLEFGEGALKEEDKRALFMAVGNICTSLFGSIDDVVSFRNIAEQVNANGEYTRVSRQIIRSIGCVIGTFIWVEYFSPKDEVYSGQLVGQSQEEDLEEEVSYLGQYIAMSFDSTDGSFYKTEYLARLHLDEEGVAEVEEVGGLFVEDYVSDEAFDRIIENESLTLTTDDYFVVNTVRRMLEKKTL